MKRIEQITTRYKGVVKRLRICSPELDKALESVEEDIEALEKDVRVMAEAIIVCGLFRLGGMNRELKEQALEAAERWMK